VKVDRRRAIVALNGRLLAFIAGRVEDGWAQKLEAIAVSEIGRSHLCLQRANMGLQRANMGLQRVNMENQAVV
jgi:hypothetical protein